MSDAVRYDVADGVATVTVNRPDAMNAADQAVRDGLRAAFEEAAEDGDVRAVLITGEGRAFCVGQDLKELLPLYEADDPDLGGIVAGFNDVATTLATLPKPTVAAINGAAAGAGASIAFACDFRIASEKASFAMAFSKIGLVPDTGASWTLPRLVGSAKALELLLLSEPVRAEEALRLGLVTRVVPAESLAEEAGAFARQLAAGPTVAYGYIKRLVAESFTTSLPDALAREAELQAAAGRTDDHVNAVRSFLAKEPPTFRGY
ncbi:MAG TPA: enoyl-CoA hydratase-related protein [Mycobacteriales bacterium]|jgi:2-(1,2-epoxy-1,2-dihydrophenyl)acetyl-CoA isomerase|nr:enoyl-CoA hydratase-related protein [Mycobacteriales bacterium]